MRTKIIKTVKNEYICSANGLNVNYSFKEKRFIERMRRLENNIKEYKQRLNN